MESDVARTLRQEGDALSQLRHLVAEAIGAAASALGRPLGVWTRDAARLARDADVLAELVRRRATAGDLAIAREQVSQSLVRVMPVYETARGQLAVMLAASQHAHLAALTPPAPAPGSPLDPWLRGHVTDQVEAVLDARFGAEQDHLAG